LAKRRTRPQSPQTGKAPAAPPAAKKEAPAGIPHRRRDPYLLWIILALFVAVEIVVILVNYDKWQYRTVTNDAKQAMAEERWQDALDYWAKHVKNYPGASNSPVLRRDRAKCRMGTGDYTGALEDLNFVLDDLEAAGKSPDAELLSDLATTEAKLGRTEKALETYRQVLNLDSTNAEANLYVGRQLLDQGKILDAARYFQAVPVDKYPEDLKLRWKVLEEQYIRKAEELATRGEAAATTGSLPPESTPAPAPTPQRPSSGTATPSP